MEKIGFLPVWAKFDEEIADSVQVVANRLCTDVDEFFVGEVQVPDSCAEKVLI